MVFGKLISRFQKKSDHPLGSDENLEVLLAEIPQREPGYLLMDVDQWLAEMPTHVEEIGAAQALTALIRLDQFSREAADELLKRYLGAGRREFMSDAAWMTLNAHASHLLNCYTAALQALAHAAESSADKNRMARSAVCALRAWALGKKLQRFRYRASAPEHWQAAHDLMRLLARCNLLQASVVAYRGEQEMSALTEYLVGVYLEMLPLGNLVAQQIEFIDNFLRYSGVLELTQEPHAHSSFQIDIAGAKPPQRRSADATGHAAMRYCSTARLRALLMKLAAQIKRQEAVPEWVRNVPAEVDQIEAAILLLILAWAPAPPQRQSERVRQENSLKVIFGFGMVRRMIAASNFARLGRTLDYEGTDFDSLFEANRFGRVRIESQAEAEVEESKPKVDPLAILEKLELAGDKAQMETWRQLDCSATGLGAACPILLARHRIGVLVGFRYRDAIDWRIAIMRRIGRDEANRPSIGLETLT